MFSSGPTSVGCLPVSKSPQVCGANSAGLSRNWRFLGLEAEPTEPTDLGSTKGDIWEELLGMSMEHFRRHLEPDSGLEASKTRFGYQHHEPGRALGPYPEV